MYENFIKLDKEKQDRILNAGYEIFAKVGYKNASTLEIAKKAYISKGALFHYFGNKHQFYLYLYHNAVDIVLCDMRVDELVKNPDFFSRIKEMAQAKMRAMRAHPYMNSFFIKAYMEEEEEIKSELNELLIQLSTDQSVMTNDIDMIRFRKPVNLDLLSNLIVNFVMNYLQSHLIRKKEIDFNQLTEEVYVYIDLLKDNFYKEEFL